GVDHGVTDADGVVVVDGREQEGGDGGDAGGAQRGGLRGAGVGGDGADLEVAFGLGVVGEGDGAGLAGVGGAALLAAGCAGGGGLSFATGGGVTAGVEADHGAACRGVTDVLDGDLIVDGGAHEFLLGALDGDVELRGLDGHGEGFGLGGEAV